MAPARKLVPVRVTVVPPVEGPLEGATVLSVGGFPAGPAALVILTWAKVELPPAAPQPMTTLKVVPAKVWARVALELTHAASVRTTPVASMKLLAAVDTDL